MGGRGCGAWRATYRGGDLARVPDCQSTKCGAQQRMNEIKRVKSGTCIDEGMRKALRGADVALQPFFLESDPRYQKTGPLLS